MKKNIKILLFVVILFMNGCVTNKRDRYESFWLWFDNNSEELFNLEDSSHSIGMNKIYHKLKKVDERLLFELSTSQSGQRELIITVNGKTNLFGLVEDFCSIKPQLDDWIIYPLRPRRDLRNSVYMYNDFPINLEQCSFLFFEAEDNKVGVLLLIESLNQSNIPLYTNAMDNLLQTLLGEKDYAKHVGQILLDNTDSKYMPYTDNIDLLANHFDKMVYELNNK